MQIEVYANNEYLCKINQSQLKIRHRLKAKGFKDTPRKALLMLEVDRA